MIGTSHPGSGTVRRPARDFGKGLNDVCPATSITVRITESRAPIEVERVLAEAGRLAPAQPGARRRRDYARGAGRAPPAADASAGLPG